MNADDVKIEDLRVSRASVLKKNFTLPEHTLRATLSAEDAEEQIPTQQEKNWWAIVEGKGKYRDVLRRKITICLDVEVEEMREDFISYEYNAKKFSVSAPINSFAISRALEVSKHNAFVVLCSQGCVKLNGMPINAEKNTLGVDELSLLVDVANRFFFQWYV